jgi:hypothetical protein
MKKAVFLVMLLFGVGSVKAQIERPVRWSYAAKKSIHWKHLSI